MLTETKRKIICYGDSNTFGHDPQSPIGRHFPADVRWTGHLDGWETVNCGLNGRQIPVGDTETQCAVAQIVSHCPASLVTVMLGTNDLLWNPGFLAEDAAARMDAFLYALSDLPDAVPLLLIAPPPMIPGEWVQEARLLTQSKRLGGLYQALAANHGVYFADAAEWAPELAYDGIHLTAEGHLRFAEGLAAVLARFFP